MNNLKEITSNFDFKINKCKYCNNIRVLDTDKGAFVAKKKNRDKNDLFKYNIFDSIYYLYVFL